MLNCNGLRKWVLCTGKKCDYKLTKRIKKNKSMCFVLYINIDTYCPLLILVYLIFHLYSNKEMDMLDSF